MDGMDIDDLRRKNLRRLEAEYGGAAAFAKVVGMSDAQYLNLRNGAKDISELRTLSRYLAFGY